MIEIIICDADGIERPEFSRRFHDNAPREVLADNTPYDFVSFKEPGMAVYHRRRQPG